MPSKILVVDDQSRHTRIKLPAPNIEGFAVVVASDGREGLYMAGAEHPDLIITDCQHAGDSLVLTWSDS